MKHAAFALTLGALSATIHAQSSLTIYGVADVGLQHARQGPASATVLQGGGASAPSRLGFRGTEDLGSGLTAGFLLESGLNVDSGTFGATSSDNQTSGTSTGLVFNRRSYVSLSSRTFGEIRLGREYVPTYWNVSSSYDPFINVGAGALSHLTSGPLNQISTGFIQTGIRASNSLSYNTPADLGGFFAQGMVALGENPSNAAAPVGRDDGKHMGLRVGYAGRQFDIAAAQGKTRRRAGDVSVTNFAGSWDFGFARVRVSLFRDSREAVVAPTAANKSQGWMLAATIPVGGGYIPVSYSTTRDNRVLPSGHARATQLAVGYVYSLSKRTSLYATWATITNKNGAAVSGGNVAAVANARWTGQDVGMRVDF